AGASATYTFNVVEDAIWNNTELAAIAFVQNDNTKEIYNSGASWDPAVNASLVGPAVVAAQGAVGLVSSFSGVVGNTGNASEDFLFTLSAANAPANWTANFKANGTTYTAPTTLTLTAGSTINADIEVTPGGTPGLAEYTLTITSVTNPTAPAMFYTVYVIEGVTTLLVNNSSGLGDGSGGNASNWSIDFENGLNFANCSTYAVTNEIVALKVADAGALNTLHKVFFNVGWTFPSLTDDLVTKLALMLDNGGRLFISGQDIAWETFDPSSGYGTPATQAFFTNYLNASFVNDGTTSANVALNFNAGDVIFGGTPNSTLINYYGGTYFYPEEINATGNGAVISYYGAGTAKKGAVRATNGIYKTVYLGYGLEMVGSTAIKNEIIKRAYDWFDNLTSTEEFDAAMLALNIGQNYPNPANQNVIIPVSNLLHDATLQVTDFTGRVVLEQAVNKQSTEVKLNTQNLNAGLYSYRLMVDGKPTQAKTMQVIR
ncbi:MAG TPA: T9SS type A sorting domain-containing protein, partial [Bacteroidia bacterium]|nr:T9SS type A sorting domain-containing protein [Bacteroidia bacterium]